MKITSSWDKEFDEKFRGKTIWPKNTQKLKSFIREQIDKAREERTKEVILDVLAAVPDMGAMKQLMLKQKYLGHD